MLSGHLKAHLPWEIFGTLTHSYRVGGGNDSFTLACQFLANQRILSQFSLSCDQLTKG